MKKESAFPFEEKHFGSDPSYHLGMSKRYWTAVMIAQAITSGHQASSDNRIMSANEITKLSFEFADAILEQEDKT